MTLKFKRIATTILQVKIIPNNAVIKIGDQETIHKRVPTNYMAIIILTILATVGKLYIYKIRSHSTNYWTNLDTPFLSKSSEELS